MSTIKSLNVALTSSGNLAHMREEIKSTFEMFQGGELDGILEKLGHTIGGGIGKSIAGLSVGVFAASEAVHFLTENFEMVAEAGERAIETIAEWVSESIHVVDAAYKAASALNISTGNFMGLATAAKQSANIDQDAFASMLEKLAKNMGEVQLRGGPAKEALQLLGLSAKDLVSIPVDKQFLRIADAISNLKSPTEQAVAATDLFGKTGAALLPMLREGAAAIEEAKDKALEYGVAVSQFDADKIERSHEAIEELQLRWEGIKNTLTESIAPAITGIARVIEALIPPADVMREKFTLWLFVLANVFDQVSQIDSVLIDIAGLDFKGLKDDLMNPEPMTNMLAAFYRLDDLMGRLEKHTQTPLIPDSAVENASKLKSELDRIQLEAATAGMDNFTKRLTEFEMTCNPTTEQIKQFTDALQTLEQAEADTKAANEAAAAVKKIGDELDNMKFEAAIAGLDDVSQAFEKMLRASDGDVDAASQAAEYQQIIDMGHEWRKTVEDVQRVHEQMMTPLEKYQEALTRINQLSMAGLSIEDQKRAKLSALLDLAKAYQDRDPGIANAAEVRFGITPQEPNSSPMDQLLQEARQQTQIATDEKTALGLIYTQLRTNATTIVDLD